MNNCRQPDSASVRLYATIVRLLLPEDFRREHGDALLHVFRQALADPLTGNGSLGRVGFWLRETAGVFGLAWRLRFQHHRSGVTPMPSAILSELRFALRRLCTQPGASFLIVLTLALGIGANTAVFSVLNGAFLDPLTYAHPSRTVSVTEQRTSDGVISGLSYGNYMDLSSEAESIEALGLYVGNSIAVTGGDGPPERVRGLFVNADYFRVVGVQPELGRAIAEGEDEPGGEAVAVLSHAYWETRFGADPSVLGRSITLNSSPHRIVGVMPADFRPYWDDASLWVSLPTVPRPMDPSARGAKNFPGMALIREGVDPQSAREELSGIMDRLRGAYPEGNADWTLRQTPMLDVIRGRQRPLVFALGAAVAVVLLLMCANLANLQLARASLRTRETAVRAALGGSRARLVGSVLLENLILALIGGVVGLGVAYLGVEVLVRLRPAWGINYDIRPEGIVLAFALVLSLFTGLVFGLAPAVRSARTNPAGPLQDGGRGRTGGRRMRRLHNALVVSQVGAAVVLLCGTGLLVRSMANLLDVDVGFDAAPILTMEFRLTGEEYDERAEQIAFFEALVPRLQMIPGVTGAGTAHGVPFSGDFGRQPIIEEGSSIDPSDAPVAIRNEVSPGYIEALQLPVLAGRTIQPGDRTGQPIAAVVSETLANQTWPGAVAVGRRLLLGDGEAATVVGVVGSVRRSLDDAPDAEIYLSAYQMPDDFVGLVIRTNGDLLAMAGPVREAVWSVEPNQPVWEVMPLTDRIGGTVQDQRFLLSLLGAFAAIGLLLAGVGVYGVLAHSVSNRTQELGVRLALGAEGRGLVRMVLREGLTLAIGGIAVGILGAYGMSRLISSLLYEVGALDPLTLLVVSGLVLTIASASAFLPASRVARMDPVRALQRG